MANDANILRNFVRLYRECDRPRVCDDGYFSFSTKRASDKLISALNKYDACAADKITRLFSGENILETPLDAAQINQPISFDCFKPANRFCQDLTAFVNETSSVHKKKGLPDVFYISERDYLHGEKEVIPEISQVEETCRLIRFLDKVITHSHPESNYTQFVLLTHDKENLAPRKQVFETRYQHSEIGVLSGLQQVEEIAEKEDLHSSERIVVFRNALAEILEKEPDPKRRFVFLLRHFDDLKEKYQQNYETYINGFALDKFKMEVVTKSDELIQKLNTTLNDIVIKVLIVPASLLALKALGGTNNITTDIMVTIAIFTISIILTCLVRHQFSNLTQIGENTETLFKEFDNREGKACTIALENRQKLLKKNADIRKYLWGFIIVVWLPFVLCLAYLLKRYSFGSIGHEMWSWVVIFWSRCYECFNQAANDLDPNN